MNKRKVIADLVLEGKTTREISQLTGFKVSVVRYYREASRVRNIIDRVAEHRRRVKRKAIDYSGGRCLHCGYDKFDGSMIFHHTGPKEKDITISNGNTRSWARILAEIDKCALLCHNCHQEFHGGVWCDETLMIKQRVIRDSYVDKPLFSYADRNYVGV